MTKAEHNGRRGRSSSQLCRPEKRQRIYARDGFRCLWCGRHASDRKVKLSLDHFLARACKGGNQTGNLFTACTGCNSARQDTPALVHAYDLAGLFEGPAEILDRILDALDRPLPVFVP